MSGPFPSLSCSHPHPSQSQWAPTALCCLANPLPWSNGGEGGSTGLGGCSRSHCQKLPGHGPGLQVAWHEQGGVGPGWALPISASLRFWDWDSRPAHRDRKLSACSSSRMPKAPAPALGGCTAWYPEQG